MEKYLKPLPINVYIYVDNYKADMPEHQDADFVSWIRSKPRDMSFNMLKEDLQEILKVNNNILCSDNIVKHVEWNEDKIIIRNGKDIEIQESDLCDFWDYIKSVRIIEVKKIPEFYIEYADVMLELFKKLKYLQPILVANSEKALGDSFGYQYTEG